MLKKMTLAILCYFIASSIALAQGDKVSGVVISSEDNEPVIGASVVVTGTATGTVTDFDGRFSFEAPTGAKTISVSYVGMQTQQQKIGQNLKIILNPTAEALEEVVVVAYGTAKKESFTGSAEVIKSESIAKRPIANVTKALDGAVAGVQSTSGSGQPGAGASVVIRGFGSISASQDPLYVVDGVPYDGSISAINPSDIASMTILKDASAGALYGARGANGVVVITTKRGAKEGNVNVNVKANWGWASRAIPRYETVDEAGYLEAVFQSYKNSAILNDGLTSSAAGALAVEQMANGSKKILGANQQYNPYNMPIQDLIDPITGKVNPMAKLRYNEDWMDEAMADSPLRQEYIATITGGDAKTQYMFSLGYLNEEGLLKTTEFERVNGRANIDSQIKSWLRAGVNASYSRNASNTAAENSASSSNVWYTAQLMAPIFPVFQKDAKGETINDNSGNPAFDYGPNRPAGANANWNTIATLYDDKYESASDNFNGRLYANFGDFKDGPLQGVKLSVNYGFDLSNGSGLTYYNPYNGNAASSNGRLTKATSRMFSYTFNQLLTWDRKFGDHTFSALAGHEFYEYRYDYLMAEKTGFPFGGLFELDAATNITAASSYRNNYAVQSVLSRLSYDYADKYYFSASFRTDGSSRFHESNRWGKFWSLGANWRISQEGFMQDVDWVNNLSLRASYGVQGNDDLGTLYAWQSFYDLAFANASMSGALVSSLENKDLRWEKNGNLNIGLEARLFDRLSATVEYYQRKTTDMLVSYPLASSLGFDGYNKNIGSMRNTGLDVSLGLDILQDTPVKWRTNLMGSTVRNKVLKLADKPEIIMGITMIREGETINSFYTASAAGVDPATGQQLYWAWDTDKDGNRGEKYVTADQVKASECRSVQGSRIPTLYGSWGNELTYKSFDLSFLTTYSLGGKIYDNVYRTLMYGNYVGNTRSVDIDRAWRNPGDITDVPRIEIGKSYIPTDNDLIDASYFAIKNVTLGYTLPSKYLKKANIANLRVSATADNVAMFTHLKGMNPQHNFTGSTDFGYVPTRTISLGVDITF